MSEVRVESLFDEYATRYLRGERPDVCEYLERAGDERDSLGALLDRFLEAVPAREPTEEEVVLMQARLEQQPPLLLMRLRRKLSREAVVEALVSKLNLDVTKRDKVGGYYHDLEVGNLDPEPVAGSVWRVLAETLSSNVRALAGLPPQRLVSGTIYLRAPSPRGDMFDLPTVFTEPAAPASEEGPDEIDRLFTGSA